MYNYSLAELTALFISAVKKLHTYWADNFKDLNFRLRIRTKYKGSPSCMISTNVILTLQVYILLKLSQNKKDKKFF